MPGSSQKCWKGWRTRLKTIFFGNSPKSCLKTAWMRILAKHQSTQLPLLSRNTAVVTTTSVMMQRLFPIHSTCPSQVTGSSVLPCPYSRTQADRSQYLEFCCSLWQRERAPESLLPAIKHLSQKWHYRFCSCHLVKTSPISMQWWRSQQEWSYYVSQRRSNNDHSKHL